jgi:hypothetical protein
MPEQFTVPQFIDAEDKILGPLTVRQFAILMLAFLVDTLLYKLLSFVTFLLVAVPILVLAGVIAFVKINGQPFHFFVLNLVQTLKRPRLRAWDKTPTDAELKMYTRKAEAPPPPPPPRKTLGTTSRLQELTLVVNTGGAYTPE